MNKFKEGDKVIAIRDGNDIKVGDVVTVEDYGLYCNVDGDFTAEESEGFLKEEDFELAPRYTIQYNTTTAGTSTITIGGEKEMSLVQKVKDLTASNEDKLLKKYNVVDSCGKLTTEGNQLLEVVVFEDYKAIVVEKLEALEAAEKKDKSKK